MSELYPMEAIDAAIRRLEKLAAKKFVYVSDGSSGSDKVAELLAFSQGALPALMDLFTSWKQAMEFVGLYPEENRWAIADRMMELATAIQHKPHPDGAEALIKALEVLDLD